MTAKHTQGPWVVGQCTWNEEGNVCYELRGIKHGSAQDARLIAAAPDLLAELQNIANANTRDWDDPNDFKAWAQNRARAAIAKATGESK